MLVMSQTPDWLRKERQDCSDGKVPFPQTWDYLRGRGVPYDHYSKMASESYQRQREQIPFERSWDYLRGRGVSWENYQRISKNL